MSGKRKREAEKHDVGAQLLRIKITQNAYKTMAFKRRDVYAFRLFLGRYIYRILQKGVIQTSHLTSEQKEALDIFENHEQVKKITPVECSNKLYYDSE